MNTSSLKTFAQNARNKLRAQVAARLNYWLGAEGGTAPDTAAHRQFAPQIKELAESLKKDGRDALVERISYTWFNRLAALRFMDANDFHPFGVRVVTPAGENEILPALLQQARAGALNAEIRAKLANPQAFDDILAGRIPVAHPETELFGMLLLAACNYYHAVMPFLFEKLGDATQLLLPEDLLSEQSILTDIRENLTDEDCTEVEVIGWLYQFYISEKKDEVMGRKKAVPTEDIPAVTQLFTPHWIVRYLVENSLGRLWLLNRPHSRLREHMPYYIEDPSPEPIAFQPEWKTSIPFQGDGDFRTFLWLRPNPDLRDDPDSAMHYALTIDGYAYAREVWGIPDASSGGAEVKLRSMIKDGKVTGSFEDLRAALFLWQRDTKWGGPDVYYGAIPTFDLCYKAVCEAWEKEWRNNERHLPDLSAHGIRQTELAQTDFLKITRPEDIKLVDPACGSGHILTYAFDLLYLIYGEEGYDAPEISSLILKHNLHGLEICERAAALAAFALCMKARGKDRRFFKRLAEGGDQAPCPHIVELQDIHFAENELGDYIKALGVGDLFNQPMLKLLYQFEETKNLGSLIQPSLDERGIRFARHAIEEKDLGGQLFLRKTHTKVLRLLKQAQALTQRYHVVVANPPYMGGGAMNPSLKEYVKKHLTLGKQDLMTCFMQRATTLAIPIGTIAVINLPSWLFLSSFEALRINLIEKETICSLLHLGRGIFGSDFGTVAFILQNCAAKGRKGTYRRLFDRHVEVDSVDEIEAKFLDQSFGRFIADQKAFRQIAGAPIAYWVTPAVRHIFATATPLKDIAKPRQGLATTNNAAFLRMWYEPAVGRIAFGMTSEDEAEQSGHKWFPLQKGGSFRKWYGNNEYVLNYERRGKTICDYIDNTPGARVGSNGRVINRQFYFREAITWSSLSISALSMRYMSKGFIFETKGSACFCDDKPLLIELLGYANSTLVNQFLQALSPTLDFHEGPIGTLPVIPIRSAAQQNLVAECISIARADWDNFETSWDFSDQPMLRPKLKSATLEASWRNWEEQSAAAVRRMQELETENNRLFIAAYSLDGELQPEVPEEQITLARADRRKDIAAFVSYAVGCMMGRYSLDAPGLILANAGETFEDYVRVVNEIWAELPEDGESGIMDEELMFPPDADSILPVLDGEWFSDDIVGRFREFLRVTFGEESFAANLRFIEESLGKPDPKTGKTKPTEIRSYFVSEFYKNHISGERAYGYKKRPIYWMISSPKGGFQALIYLHRYTRDTLNRVLDGYVRPFLDKLEQRQQACTVISNDAAAKPAARTAAAKELLKLGKMLKEIREWERDTLLPLAQKRIELDLDDGVKVNYLKFKGILVPIAGLEKKEED